MTRIQRRRRKRIRKARRIIAWIMLIAYEIVIAAIPTAVMATVAIPFAYLERGGAGAGGEWILITVVFCWAFRMIHNKVCDRIYEEV